MTAEQIRETLTDCGDRYGLEALDVMEAALRELSSVPDAGPFANKGACRAFAGYVQKVANRGLAARSPSRTERGAE